MGVDYKLSGAARHAKERGETLSITEDNVDDLVGNAPRTVREKSNTLLQYIESKTYPGSEIMFDAKTDYPLAYCRDATEFSFLLKTLAERNEITTKDILTNKNHDGKVLVQARLEPQGWIHLESLANLRPDSRKVFVAMSFDPNLKYIFNDGIKPACEANGFEAIRVDNQQFNEVVYDKIVAGIRESRFVIADVTQQKTGVYFEGGFAKGLGLTVIWTWKCDEESKPHFDIQHFNHIHWKTVEELKEKLDLRIRATIGSIKK